MTGLTAPMVFAAATVLSVVSGLGSGEGTLRESEPPAVPAVGALPPMGWDSWLVDTATAPL